MSSSSLATSALSPHERLRILRETLPANLFRSVGGGDEPAAWRLAPKPVALAPQTVSRIRALGPAVLLFQRALNSLYFRSVKGTAPSFVAEYLDQGKPESVIKLARQNRFKSDIPGVIRPDLILTEEGFIASELDSLPGGMGFVAAMTAAYAALDAPTIGGRDGMALSLAAMLATSSQTERPVAALVVSSESEDYREEIRWLANRMRALNLAEAHVVAPQDIVFSEEALFMRLSDGREEKIDILYRNFELFDLQNVPKSELILYAARHNRVKITPPPKAHLEEKLAFALLHHPRLASYWRKEITPEHFALLLEVFPQTWVLDPQPLPAQAAISGLEVNGEPLQDWMSLVSLGKGDRNYVIKPSGFSELAWGSRGVKIANDMTKEAWEAGLRDALAQYPQTPHILQRFHKGRRVKLEYIDTQQNVLRPLDGRVRLCPYYFVVGDEAQLGGILATVVPADKRLIHGMSDAIMAPCVEAEGGI